MAMTANLSKSVQQKSGRTRLIKRQVEPSASGDIEDATPSTDLNCTGPCAERSEETLVNPDDNEDGLPEDHARKIDIYLNTMFENLSDTKEGPQSETNLIHPNDGSFKLQTADNNDTFSLVRQNKSAAKLQTHDELLASSHGSFAVGAIFSLLWVASVYGIISIATDVKELLIAPIVMFVLASVLCVGIIFIDLEAIEASGFLGMLLNLLIGAVVKIGSAIVLLYCFFVVFSYYKELRDDEITLETPPQSVPSTPVQPASPSRPPSPKQSKKGSQD